MSQPLVGRQLQAVVMAVGAGVELRDRAKSRVFRLLKGKRLEAAWARGLIAVDLRLVGLVHRAGAGILRAQTHAGPDLMLQAKAPLHVIGRAELAIRDSRDGKRL